MLKKSFHLVIKHKIQSFNKIIKVDSDKSISIRSLLIGAISQNISHIKKVFLQVKVNFERRNNNLIV